MRFAAVRLLLLPGLLLAPTALAAGQAAAMPTGRDTNDPVAHYEAAMRRWVQRDWDAAERSLREAVALAPDYPDASLALSLLFDKRGDRYWKAVERAKGRETVERARAESKAAWRRAFLADPLVDLKLYLEAATDDPPAPDAPWWAVPFDRAVDAHARGDGREALGHLREIATDIRAGGEAERLPDDVLWFRALVAAHEREFGTAIAELARLTDRAEPGPDSAAGRPLLSANDYRYVLATVRYQAGRFDEAVATFEAAIARDLSLYQAHTQLARIHQAAGRWDLAVTERQRAIAANPEEPNLVVELGATLFDAGRMREARGALADVSRRAPRDPRIPYLLAVIALREGDTLGARQAFRRFLEIAPSRYGTQIEEANRRLSLED